MVDLSMVESSDYYSITWGTPTYYLDDKDLCSKYKLFLTLAEPGTKADHTDKRRHLIVLHSCNIMPCEKMPIVLTF